MVWNAENGLHVTLVVAEWRREKNASTISQRPSDRIVKKRNNILEVETVRSFSTLRLFVKKRAYGKNHAAHGMPCDVW